MTPDRIAACATRLTDAVTTDGRDATSQEVRRLAREFEALLLTQMVRDMRRTMTDDDGRGSEFGPMTDTVDAELGRTLSAAGGFGLSAALLGALDRLARLDPRSLPAARPARGIEEESTRDASSSVPRDAAVSATPGSGGPLAALEPAGADGRVTSGFGWRSDPLRGTPRFHQGVDIAMAYGQDVRAAGDGVVTFAGEQNGYGTMVAVTHADGRETRYAHLSEHAVKVGDRIEGGQILGKSGRSGRATGPHLHVELRVNGRAVDPATERGARESGGGHTETASGLKFRRRLPITEATAGVQATSDWRAR